MSIVHLGITFHPFLIYFDKFELIFKKNILHNLSICNPETERKGMEYAIQNSQNTALSKVSRKL